MLCVPEQEDALLGAGLFLVAARPADGGVEPPLVQRLLEGLGLHHVGVHGGAVADRTDALGNAIRVGPDMQLNPRLGGAAIGFRNGEDLGSATDGTLTFTSTADEFSDVGNYAIIGGGLSAGNYVFAQDPGNATALTIDPATLTFIADPFTRLVGQPNGLFTGVVTGFRNGEDLGSATDGTLTFTSIADQI